MHADPQVRLLPAPINFADKTFSIPDNLLAGVDFWGAVWERLFP